MFPDLKVGKGGKDWSGAFIFRREGNTTEILVIEYTKNGNKSIKIAGGCCLPGQNPVDALGNEIVQELGPELISMEKVHFAWTNEKVPGVHHQHFFVTPFNNLQGRLRTEEMYDEDELLGPPFWMDIDTALRKLFVSHHQGLTHALDLIKYCPD